MSAHIDVPSHVEAAVVRDPDDRFTLEKLELSSLGPLDVLVKIAGAGMCHTDLAVRGPAGRPLRPIVLGHEGSGVVAAVGSQVTKAAVGDPVVLSYDSCGGCGNCRSGRPYFCATWMDRNTGPGLSREHATLADAEGRPVNNTFFGQSSFAEYSVASQNNVVKVSPELPLEILGPLGCGLQTGAGAIVNVLQVRPGQSVVVFGAGAVGLAAVMAARICGASAVVAVDVVEGRRQLALDVGATHALDGAAPELLDQLQRITSGADCAFDTTGRAAVIATAVDALAQGGTCALAAPGEELRLPAQQIVFGRRLVGVLEGDAVPDVFIPQMIDWWQSGVFPFDKLIERFPLREINEAAEASTSGRVVKPLLIP
ncbi:NAD(P)-dependent alcohol dehydrogenase [Streptomyces sp. NPDC001536]|uniref:NAD(P)-dependent alcohol dehydrogenase n=1 Tax=Streptomyces sp. NPDC001536 TaxID=3364583 RepID=UPI0036C1489C